MKIRVDAAYAKWSAPCPGDFAPAPASPRFLVESQGVAASFQLANLAGKLETCRHKRRCSRFLLASWVSARKQYRPITGGSQPFPG
jgi:hypothetical protein